MENLLKLLIPGWAGLLTLEEARFIQIKLQSSQPLRRKWGIRGKKPYLPIIARKAYPEEPKLAIAELKKQQSRISQRIYAKAKIPQLA